jgi:hypothetical protein
LKRRRQKVKDAYFADAMSIEELKVEQQQIGRDLAAAEAILQRHVAATRDLETGIDAALNLLADPAGSYRAAPDAIRRLLVQELFDKIWILDHRLIGADLTRPYTEVLGIEAQGVARAAGETDDAGLVSYDRRDPAWSPFDRRTYLRVERPYGQLAFDAKNSRPDEPAGSSNFPHLVDETDDEPPAEPTRRIRRAERKRSANPASSRAVEPEPAGPRLFFVSRVIDGDTLELGNGRSVRLVGVDAPEVGECGFDRATANLERLVFGRQVRLGRVSLFA